MIVADEKEKGRRKVGRGREWEVKEVEGEAKDRVEEERRDDGGE